MGTEVALSVSPVMVRGTPKTKRTERIVFLLDATARLLRDFRQSQKLRVCNLSLGRRKWCGDDFVITALLGTPFDPSNFRIVFDRLLSKAGSD